MADPRTTPAPSPLRSAGVWLLAFGLVNLLAYGLGWPFWVW